jgi:pimeloyl-ACP methyl ester carboxylesterase/DNA-binding winged helix-turn-helix (wHTH) protein
MTLDRVLPASASQRVAFSDFEMDLVRNQLRTLGGEHIPLRPRSLAVLRLLACHLGQVVTKDEMMQQVWHDVIVTDDSLTQCIADIRRAIGDRDHRIVRTVPRTGYLLAQQATPEIASGPAATQVSRNTEPASKSPPTSYAKSGDYYIAYQVTGEGPVDLVFVQGYVTHLELEWDDFRPARLYEELSSFTRLIRFDKRGTGLSDRVHSLPTLEERMDDVRAVMDAVGSRQAILLGSSEGAPMSLLFCATYPERVTSLILYGAMARAAWASDNPWGRTDEQLRANLKLIEEKWGTGHSVDIFAPSIAGNKEYRQWRARLDRAGATPGAAMALATMNYGIDVRHVLPLVRVPTLILHRREDRAVNVAHSRDIANRIRDAKYVELEGVDHAPWVGNTDAVCREIRSFVAAQPPARRSDRVFTTILFVEFGFDGFSGEGTFEIGSGWRSMVRSFVEGHNGRPMQADEGSYVAVFDGPGRGIRCAQALVEELVRLGIGVRAGIHASECDVWHDRLEESAVHVGAAVARCGRMGEVIVTCAAASLVAGSGLALVPYGERASEGLVTAEALFIVA